MHEWFKTSLGQSIADAEVEKCDQLIPTAYYANGLQVGLPGSDFLDSSGAVNRYLTDFRALDGQIRPEGCHFVVSRSDALPFPERSQDLIVLPHTLDFCDRPHDVLRQVDQILEPEGCLVIVGFNAVSFYGALKLFRNRQNPPWSGHYYSVRRVQDWLSLLDYDLVGAGMMAYQLPIQSEQWRQRISFMENAGDRWWPGLGGVYVIAGRKRVTAITLKPKKSRSWQRLINGMAQPASQRAARMGIKLVSKNQTEY
jgi:SAM-dependent methyltransferase